MDGQTKAYIEERPIECMFFSEFHHTQGPKITFQNPEGYFQQQTELFEEVINYIIPKPEMQQKLITVNTGSKKVIGCPVCIEGTHYPRNNYIFNFGLVLDNKHKSSPCIPLIKQLSKYMTEIELESRFVSSKDTKELIPKILKDMFVGLNEYGKCSVRVNDSTTLFLKVFFPTTRPPQVRDHDVPIMLTTLEEIVPMDWDLTTEQILPCIDGFRHVQKIAALADVDPYLTRICIQDLAFYQLVGLISIFQYSNVYVTNANFVKLMRNKLLQDSCIKYVSRPGPQSPSLHDIMKIYFGLSRDVTVENLCKRHPQQFTRVNEQKLIQFGLIHKLIRRIHVFPVKITESSDQEIRQYFTGEFNTDEICCKTGLSSRDLISRMELDPSVYLCSK